MVVIQKEVVKRLIESPRNKQQMLFMLENLPSFDIPTAYKKVGGEGSTHYYICSNCDTDVNPDDTQCLVCGSFFTP